MPPSLLSVQTYLRQTVIFEYVEVSPISENFERIISFFEKGPKQKDINILRI